MLLLMDRFDSTLGEDTLGDGREYLDSCRDGVWPPVPSCRGEKGESKGPVSSARASACPDGLKPLASCRDLVDNGLFTY